MYNPFPYHDPKPVNRPELSKKTIDSIVGGGTQMVAKKFITSIADKVRNEGAIVAFDGYTTTKFDLMVSLLARECDVFGFKIEFVDSYKRTFRSGEEIDAIIDPLLIWDKKIDPTLLYGKIYHGGYTGLMDPDRMAAFRQDVAARRQKGKVVAVYGYGCLVRELRAEIPEVFPGDPFQAVIHGSRAGAQDIQQEKMQRDIPVGEAFRFEGHIQRVMENRAAVNGNEDLLSGFVIIDF